MAPVYVPPQFNVLASVWRPPNLPSLGAPNFTLVTVQVYTYSRTPQQMLHPESDRWLPVIIIRFPYTSAIHWRTDDIFSHNAIPQETIPYYKAQYVVRMHAGFPNQYMAAYCLQCNANGTIPRTPLPT